MATHTSLPNDQLTPWYSAVRWAQFCMQNRIASNERLGYSSEYDSFQLKVLEEMEQFLQTSWDVYMEDLEQDIKTLQACTTAVVGHE